ncbi:MAG TPA: ParB/RepB/Spo0J family partition protein [Clostridia bacterium]|nr:ParB/RepB/Spo0J family partition protein [Clostridia bacterium]
MTAKRALGKGLQALFPPTPAFQEGVYEGRVVELQIDQIEPGTFQPRQKFDQEKLQELASSIKEHGVVQPIVVRRLPEGEYRIVAGERRWRACKQLKLATIPAIIKDYSDREVTEIALIENVQREDLNPLEEAVAYKMLVEEFDLTQEELSQRIGKSRSFIANMLRLLNLSEPVQELVLGGSLSAGHARALVPLPPAGQLKLAKKIIKEGLSVRETEVLARGVNQLGKEKTSSSPARPRERRREEAGDILLSDLEDSLRSFFGTKVAIKHKGQKGAIVIEYYSEEELERILELVLKE